MIRIKYYIPFSTIYTNSFSNLIQKYAKHMFLHKNWQPFGNHSANYDDST